jgi:hypothetical protein
MRSAGPSQQQLLRAVFDIAHVFDEDHEFLGSRRRRTSEACA